MTTLGTMEELPPTIGSPEGQHHAALAADAQGAAARHAGAAEQSLPVGVRHASARCCCAPAN